MSKIAHRSALPYITWGLVWDLKKRKERTINDTERSNVNIFEKLFSRELIDRKFEPD